MFCSNCGNSLIGSERFCGKCGFEHNNAPPLDTGINKTGPGAPNIRVGKKQLAIILSAALGVAGVFLPIVTRRFFGGVFYLNLPRAVSNDASFAYIWLAPAPLLIVLAVCIFLGSNFTTGKKLLCSAAGVLSAVLAVVSMLVISSVSGWNLAFGLFLLLFASIVVSILPFIKALD